MAHRHEKSRYAFLLVSQPTFSSPTTTRYQLAYPMDTLMTAVASDGGKDSEDALKVLGRIADAFDDPGSLHKTDKEMLFVVNVVKSRHLLTVCPFSFSTRPDVGALMRMTERFERGVCLFGIV